jgi:peptidoglycan/xylan/chitin deacetylase (PgdA/CDA1 family)
MGEVYYRWDDRRVLCAVGLDTVSGNDVESVEHGLDRAAADGSVLMLFTHAPGRTMPVDKLEAVLAHADAIGLPALTFRDLVDGPPRAGYSISYDDSDVDAWYATRDLLARYDARVSLFLTRYDQLGDTERAELRELADLGHDVEAHTVRHLRAPDYVEEHGLRAYLDDEALPSIERLRDDGYDPVAFAYPFGARTSEIDAALLDHVQLLRSVSFSTGVPLVADPCPE